MKSKRGRNEETSECANRVEDDERVAELFFFWRVASSTVTPTPPCPFMNLMMFDFFWRNVFFAAHFLQRILRVFLWRSCCRRALIDAVLCCNVCAIVSVACAPQPWSVLSIRFLLRPSCPYSSNIFGRANQNDLQQPPTPPTSPNTTHRIVICRTIRNKTTRNNIIIGKWSDRGLFSFFLIFCWFRDSSRYAGHLSWTGWRFARATDFLVSRERTWLDSSAVLNEWITAAPGPGCSEWQRTLGTPCFDVDGSSGPSTPASTPSDAATTAAAPAVAAAAAAVAPTPFAAVSSKLKRRSSRDMNMFGGWLSDGWWWPALADQETSSRHHYANLGVVVSASMRQVGSALAQGPRKRPIPEISSKPTHSLLFPLFCLSETFFFVRPRSSWLHVQIPSSNRMKWVLVQ